MTTSPADVEAPALNTYVVDSASVATFMVKAADGPSALSLVDRYQGAEYNAVATSVEDDSIRTAVTLFGLSTRAPAVAQHGFDATGRYVPVPIGRLPDPEETIRQLRILKENLATLAPLVAAWEAVADGPSATRAHEAALAIVQELRAQLPMRWS